MPLSSASFAEIGLNARGARMGLPACSMDLNELIRLLQFYSFSRPWWLGDYRDNPSLPNRTLRMIILHYCRANWQTDFFGLVSFICLTSAQIDGPFSTVLGGGPDCPRSGRCRHLRRVLIQMEPWMIKDPLFMSVADGVATITINR